MFKQGKMLLLAGLAVAALSGSLAGRAAESNAVAVQASVHTPAKGSTERKAILDVMRGMAKKMSGLDVVFVVTHLSVGNGWAWVEAEPQSADGSQHYEPMTGLLHAEKGRWRYVEGPPEWSVCEEDPGCADTARYFKALAKKHPGVPPAIFPAQ